MSMLFKEKTQRSLTKTSQIYGSSVIHTSREIHKRSYWNQKEHKHSAFVFFLSPGIVAMEGQHIILI